MHLLSLWEALGGKDGINDLIRYFPARFTRRRMNCGWLDGANQSGSLITLVFRDKASGDVVGHGKLHAA